MRPVRWRGRITSLEYHARVLVAVGIEPGQDDVSRLERRGPLAQTEKDRPFPSKLFLI